MAQHLAPADHAQPGDDVGARHFVVVLAAGGERRELEEGRAGVEQQAQPLARQQLVLPTQALQVAFGARLAGMLLLPAEAGHDLVERPRR
ncbi:MAG: hypothetical protein Q8L49_17340 [Burkholderiaceae bacterium]|nr:hypothetical protein [Burkholderiaceae bacterium]